MIFLSYIPQMGSTPKNPSDIVAKKDSVAGSSSFYAFQDQLRHINHAQNGIYTPLHYACGNMQCMTAEQLHTYGETAACSGPSG